MVVLRSGAVKIVSLTDIHGRIGAVNDIAADLESADLVILPGDLTTFGKREEAERIVNAVRNHNSNILAVMGNCDCPEVEQFLTDEGLCIHRSHRRVNGIVFAGLGGSLKCPIPTLNEWTEEQVTDHLEAAMTGAPSDVPLVLVSHQPARDTVTDLASNGAHVGSTAVRAFIERRKPLLCLSGHIHEARGTDAIGPTTLVNPGPFMEGRYVVVEIDGNSCHVGIRRAGAE
jgi:Icc-related predicted phosphoesterase